eukprot:6468680-Ditylum_brightwellii.AAC.1
MYLTGTSYENVICIDDSDDDKTGSPQPSVVGSGAVQEIESKVADMVEAQTKEYLATMLRQMQANNSSSHMGNMCSSLLSQMQVAENTVDMKKAATSDAGDKKMPANCKESDRKKSATSDAGDKKMPAKRKESVVVGVEEVQGHIMDEKLSAASKVDNAPLKKKACVMMEKKIPAPMVCKKTAQNKIMSSPCAKSPPQKKKQSILAKKTCAPSP